MDNQLIIPMHSFVDVITNSSTELFVCDTHKTRQQIGDILKELLSQYNGKTGNRYAFRDTFRDPVLVSKKNIDEIGDDCYWGFDDKHSPRKRYLLGKIVIYGTDDNSIPYDLFDEIEQTFNANRFHLG